MLFVRAPTKMPIEIERIHDSQCVTVQASRMTSKHSIDRRTDILFKLAWTVYDLKPSPHHSCDLNFS